MATQPSSGNEKATVRKHPTRSKLLFPAYNFDTAFQIAKTVELEGNGSLTEESLAIALDLSVKSSGFKLKTLTARQFGLLTKSGEVITSTPLTEAIVRPTQPGVEDVAARVDSFMRIPLFSAVADKYKGTALPGSDVLRNVLMREFFVEPDRVQAAERMFLDSARAAGVLVSQNGRQYLTVNPQILAERGSPSAQPPATFNPPPVGNIPPSYTVRHADPPPTPAPATEGAAFTISAVDLSDMGEEDFDEVWGALGKLFRAQGKRQSSAQDHRSADRQRQTDEQPGGDPSD